jgi:hypothetical protein
VSPHKRTSLSGLQAMSIVCRIIAKSALLLMAALPVQSAFAQAVAPDELLKTVTEYHADEGASSRSHVILNGTSDC